MSTLIFMETKMKLKSLRKTPITSSSVLLDVTTDSTSVKFDVLQNYYTNTDTSFVPLADNTLTRP